MTYVREVTKLTIITLAYIDYFYLNTHWPPWRSGCLGGFGTHVSRVRISGIAFFCHYYYSANLQIQHYRLYSVSPTLLLLIVPRPPAHQRFD